MSIVHRMAGEGDEAEIEKFRAELPRRLQLTMTDLLDQLLPRFDNLKRVSFTDPQIQSSIRFNALVTGINQTLQRCRALKDLEIYFNIALKDSDIAKVMDITARNSNSRLPVVAGDSLMGQELPRLDKLIVSFETALQGDYIPDPIRIWALEKLFGILWPSAQTVTYFGLRCPIYKDSLVRLAPTYDSPWPISEPLRVYTLPKVKDMQVHLDMTSLRVLNNWFVVDASAVNFLELEATILRENDDDIKIEYEFCSSFRNVSLIGITYEGVWWNHLIKLLDEIVLHRDSFKRLERIRARVPNTDGHMIQALTKRYGMAKKRWGPMEKTEIILLFQEMKLSGSIE
ncbi:hypothetical protein TWF694_006536 [Orbilia ellipsospora]